MSYGVYEIDQQMEKVDALLEKSAKHMTQQWLFKFELAVYGIKLLVMALIYIGQCIVALRDPHRPS